MSDNFHGPHLFWGKRYIINFFRITIFIYVLLCDVEKIPPHIHKRNTMYQSAQRIIGLYKSFSNTRKQTITKYNNYYGRINTRPNSRNLDLVWLLAHRVISIWEETWLLCHLRITHCSKSIYSIFHWVIWVLQGRFTWTIINGWKLVSSHKKLFCKELFSRHIAQFFTNFEIYTK